jgi:hypothetical protein
MTLMAQIVEAAQKTPLPVIFDPLDVRDCGMPVHPVVVQILANPARSNWWPTWWGWTAAMAMAVDAEEIESTLVEHVWHKLDGVVAGRWMENCRV